jgi:hypothetical protein
MLDFGIGVLIGAMVTILLLALVSHIYGDEVQ